MMSPVRATMNPAPAETFRLWTVMSKVFRCSKFLRIIGQTVLCLRHTDRCVAESKIRQLFYLLLGCCRKYCFITTIDLLHDLIQFIFDRSFQFICIVEITWFLTQTYHFFCKLQTAFAALCPYFRKVPRLLRPLYISPLQDPVPLWYPSGNALIATTHGSPYTFLILSTCFIKFGIPFF